MDILRFIWLLSLLICCQGNSIKAKDIIYKTPDSKNYLILLNSDLSKRESIAFQVKTCHDAHIALINGYTESDQRFEFIIMGKNKRQKPLENRYMDIYLDCSRFKSFVINWNLPSLSTNKGSKIKVGIQDDSNIWIGPSNLNSVKAIGFYNGPGTTGEWMFNTEGNEVHISTPDSEKYFILKNLVVPTNNAIRFQLKSCHDGHIALIDGETDADMLYEVVIGGSMNSKTEIRRRKQHIPLVHTVYGRYLDCTQFVEFWINWDDSYVNISQSMGHPFFIWKSGFNVGTITNIGIHNGLGSIGEWKFNYKDTSNIKTHENVTSDVTTAIQQSITVISSTTYITNGITTSSESHDNNSTTGTQMDRTTSISQLQGNSSTTVTLMDNMASPPYICHCLMPPSKWCSRVHAHTKEEELKMILRDINELKKYLTVQKEYTSKYMRTKKSAPDARKSSQYIGVTAVIIVCVPVVLVSTSDIFNFIVWFNRKAIFR